MEGIGKEGELVRTSEKKPWGQVKLARVSGGRRREGGKNRNFSLKRLAGSNQITLRFRVKQEDLSFGINNGCKTCWFGEMAYGLAKKTLPVEAFSFFFFFCAKTQPFILFFCWALTHNTTAKPYMNACWVLCKLGWKDPTLGLKGQSTFPRHGHKTQNTSIGKLRSPRRRRTNTQIEFQRDKTSSLGQTNLILKKAKQAAWKCLITAQWQTALN